MEEHVAYVLYSEKHDKLYIGYSSSSVDRFRSHNFFATKGFTTRYRPWKMIHIEFFETKKCAYNREKQLKGGQGRSWIRTSIIPSSIELGFLSA